MSKEINLTFDVKTGKMSMETGGFKGGECKDITKFLEEVLGTVESEKFKAEYYDVQREVDALVNTSYCG